MTKYNDKNDVHIYNGNDPMGFVFRPKKRVLFSFHPQLEEIFFDWTSVRSITNIDIILDEHLTKKVIVRRFYTRKKVPFSLPFDLIKGVIIIIIAQARDNF